jgi:hypothetical protein
LKDTERARSVSPPTGLAEPTSGEETEPEAPPPIGLKGYDRSELEKRIEDLEGESRHQKAEINRLRTQLSNQQAKSNVKLEDRVKQLEQEERDAIADRERLQLSLAAADKELKDRKREARAAHQEMAERIKTQSLQIQRLTARLANVNTQAKRLVEMSQTAARPAQPAETTAQTRRMKRRASQELRGGTPASRRKTTDSAFQLDEFRPPSEGSSDTENMEETQMARISPLRAKERVRTAPTKQVTNPDRQIAEKLIRSETKKGLPTCLEREKAALAKFKRAALPTKPPQKKGTQLARKMKPTGSARGKSWPRKKATALTPAQVKENVRKARLAREVKKSDRGEDDPESKIVASPKGYIALARTLTPEQLNRMQDDVEYVFNLVKLTVEVEDINQPNVQARVRRLPKNRKIKYHEWAPLDVECPICEESFRNTGSLRAHLESKHPEEERPFECLECDIDFKFVADYDRHMSRKADRPFKCPVAHCGKRFALAEGVRDHEGVHTENHKCRKCAKTFANARSLRKHGAVHNPQKVKCSSCNKWYATEYDRNAHVKRMHSEQLAAQC